MGAASVPRRLEDGRSGAAPPAASRPPGLGCDREKAIHPWEPPRPSKPRDGEPGRAEACPLRPARRRAVRALKFKFERPQEAESDTRGWGIEESSLGEFSPPRPSGSLQVTHWIGTHFSFSEFEPPFPSSLNQHANSGAMDPFTEVRKFAGAACHPRSRPLPTLPTFCRPLGPPGRGRVRARAQRVCAGRSWENRGREGAGGRTSPTLRLLFVRGLLIGVRQWSSGRDVLSLSF